MNCQILISNILIILLAILIPRVTASLIPILIVILIIIQNQYKYCYNYKLVS